MSEFDKLLKRLAWNYLHQSVGSDLPVLLVGPPGVGKSTLTIEAFNLLILALTTLSSSKYLNRFSKRCKQDPTCNELSRELKRELENTRDNNPIAIKIRELNLHLEEIVAHVKLLNSDDDNLFLVYDESLSLKNYKNSFTVVYLPLHTMEPTDLMGIPVKSDDHMSYVPPKWLKALNMSAFGLLVLDEFTNVTDPNIQSALFSLLLEKRVGMSKLRQPVVATGNPAKYSPIATNLPTPLIVGRMRIFEVGPPTVIEWTEYMERKYKDSWFKPLAPLLNFYNLGSPDTMSNVFMDLERAERVTEIDFDSKSEMGRPYPTPRAWEFVARSIRALSDVLLSSSTSQKSRQVEEIRALVLSYVQIDEKFIDDLVYVIQHEELKSVLEKIVDIIVKTDEKCYPGRDYLEYISNRIRDWVNSLRRENEQYHMVLKVLGVIFLFITSYMFERADMLNTSRLERVFKEDPKAANLRNVLCEMIKYFKTLGEEGAVSKSEEEVKTLEMVVRDAILHSFERRGIIASKSFERLEDIEKLLCERRGDPQR